MGPNNSTNYAMTANFIAYFEGFEENAYWDVNAWRIGFGSDTQWNGTERVPVIEGSFTSRASAMMDLQLRIPVFEEKVRAQAGDMWARMGANQRAALLDFAYNYGSLTPTLARYAASGAFASVAYELKNRGRDNGGENATRRACEAALFATGA